MARWLVALGLAGCAHGSAWPAATEHTARFAGAVTDMGFACWSDSGPCTITVGNAVIVVVEGGFGPPREPTGSVIGIAISGDSADALKARYLGKRVEVYAAETPEMDAQGNITGYRTRALTLAGSTAFYVRLAAR
ncbi:MAG TPA: hypothetical protein VLX92_11820 [Kofleriaceae bacterium]|nr:hypothetical protein [Kofleriaceae bacterium]